MRNEFDLIIEPGCKELHYWKDLWRYRELFYFLSWRDILVRYKQTVIGIAWSVIRPLLTMIVFTIIFGKLAKLPSNGVPYPVMVFAAMLPWQFFANALGESSNSLITNSNLMTKVYFPRLIVPATSLVVSLIDFIISFAMLACLMVWYRFFPDWRIVTLPIFIVIAFFTAFGLGLWLSALNVKYRDFRYVVPFMIQLGLYISPVGFSSSIIPENWRLLYSLNPMVGVIDGFRWALLGGRAPFNYQGLLLAMVMAAAVFFAGIRYFRAVEESFADII